MDFERHQKLHSIILLKEVLRKWWLAELRFADREGVVREWSEGPLRPPPNALCQLSLSSREGLRHCSHSLRALHERFRSAGRLRHALTQECHLGFTIVGAPLYIHDTYEGFLFVEGLTRAQLTPRDAEVLRERLRALTAMPAGLEGAVERLPRMDLPDVQKLTDLLELAAGEIAHFETTRARHTLPSPPLPDTPGVAPRFDRIVGTSPPMRELFRLLERVSNSESTILIHGESGTGKELVARAIHDSGPRRDRPFVVQNCSAFNDNLLESALFGHVKGSFTGALRDQKGLFEVADGGTFFLDEVGDMSPALQVKLLRVLQEGTFLPVGGTSPRQVDVRVIAATHKDLGALVERGEFREDLYYRINVIRVAIPPLRERRDDLPLLVDHFLRKHHRPGLRVRALSPETLAVLSAYGWPGNIRELENEVERLLVLGSDLEVIPVDLVSPRIREALGPSGAPASMASRAGGRLNDAVEHLERELIAQGLARTGGNRSRLARELGISRSNLILKISKYGLERGRGLDGEADA